MRPAAHAPSSRRRGGRSGPRSTGSSAVPTTASRTRGSGAITSGATAPAASSGGRRPSPSTTPRTPLPPLAMGGGGEAAAKQPAGVGATAYYFQSHGGRVFHPPEVQGYATQGPWEGGGGRWDTVYSDVVNGRGLREPRLSRGACLRGLGCLRVSHGGHPESGHGTAALRRAPASDAALSLCEAHPSVRGRSHRRLLPRHDPLHRCGATAE